MTNRVKMVALVTTGFPKTLEDLEESCLATYDFEDCPIEESFPAMATKKIKIDGEEYYIKMEINVTKIK